MQTSKDSFLIPKGGSFLSKEGSCKPQKILSSSPERDFNLTERDYLYLQRDSSLPPKILFFTPKDIVLYPKDVDSNLEGVMPPERGVVQVSKDVLHHTHNISIMT